MRDSDSGWLAGFKADYQTLFVEEWSPFVGAMLVGLTLILAFPSIATLLPTLMAR